MVTDPSRHARLIDGLAQDLKPVRPLPSPLYRAMAWIALLLAATAALAVFGDAQGLRQRIVLVPAVGWAMLGSGLTAILAAIAAFLSSVPGRNQRWGLLPLPALLLWITTSGLGCLGAAAAESGQPVSLRLAMRECLPFLLMVSIPFSALLFAMLRRGFPPRPGRTAALAGMAAAAGAATLLNFVHPFEVAAIDLLVHGTAVAGIVLVSRIAGRRWLSGLSSGA